MGISKLLYEVPRRWQFSEKVFTEAATHGRCSVKKVVLNNFANFTEKQGLRVRDVQKISLQVVQNMATKDYSYTKSKEIKCKMEMWKRNSSPGSQVFSCWEGNLGKMY